MALEWQFQCDGSVRAQSFYIKGVCQSDFLEEVVFKPSSHSSTKDWAWGMGQGVGGKGCSRDEYKRLLGSHGCSVG